MRSVTEKKYDLVCQVDSIKQRLESAGLGYATLTAVSHPRCSRSDARFSAEHETPVNFPTAACTSGDAAKRAVLVVLSQSLAGQLGLAFRG